MNSDDLQTEGPLPYTEPVVTVVIVTYRSRATIGQALDALFPAYQQRIATVVVVDNASPDDTADFVASSFPWVQLLRSEQNMGFGRGCNLGFQQVTSPYVLFLNPDAVMDMQALRTLVSFLDQHADAAVAAPATLASGQPNQAAGMMTTVGSVVRAATGFGEPYPQKRLIVLGDAPFQTTWVCGAAMLIRSSVFRQVGGFDPRFFLYFEETDLCRRIGQHGGTLWAMGTAVVNHVGGHSAVETQQSLTSGCLSEHYYRSRFYYLVKHFGWAPAVFAELVALILNQMRQWKRWVFSKHPTPARTPGARPFLKLPAFPQDVGCGGMALGSRSRPDRTQ